MSCIPNTEWSPMPTSPRNAAEVGNPGMNPDRWQQVSQLYHAALQQDPRERGRFLAQFEVYVRPFPDVNSGHWQVSTGGGTRPLWARNGQELFYVSLAGALMRVGVERVPSWAATTPTLLIKAGCATLGSLSGRTYDISPDGQRFLLIKEGGGSEQAAAPVTLVVVQHFDEELKRLVPTN
jgi:hypothetical protein